MAQKSQLNKKVLGFLAFAALPLAVGAIQVGVVIYSGAVKEGLGLAGLMIFAWGFLGLIYLAPELEVLLAARRAAAPISGRSLKTVTDRIAAEAGLAWAPTPGTAGISVRRTDGTLVVGRTEMLVPVAAVAGADEPTEWPTGQTVTPVSWGIRLSRWAARTRNWWLLNLLRVGDDLGFWLAFGRKRWADHQAWRLRDWYSQVQLRWSGFSFRLGQWLSQPVGGDRWRWGDSHEESKGLALWVRTALWELAYLHFWGGLIGVGIFLALAGVILLITLAGILGWSAGLEGQLAIALVSLLVLTGAFAILAMALTFAIELIAAAIDWLRGLPRWVWLVALLAIFALLGGSAARPAAPSQPVVIIETTILTRVTRIVVVPYSPPASAGTSLPVKFAFDEDVQPYPGLDVNVYACCRISIVRSGDTVYGSLWTVLGHPPSEVEIEAARIYNDLEWRKPVATPRWILIRPGQTLRLPVRLTPDAR